MSARYAVYFSPDDDSGLARFGERVLGRTADGRGIAPSNEDFTDPLLAKALSATPSHYGFHATLKAPFHLKSGVSELQLIDAVEALAAQHKSIDMHTLRPAKLAGFIALCFENQPAAIDQLAALCVKQLEPLRAALSQEAIARRKPQELNTLQREYLYRYGYPYVLREFRFHMTLTGPMKPAEHVKYFAWLRKLYTRHVPSAPCLDKLDVFWQKDETSSFIRLAQFPLG